MSGPGRAGSSHPVPRAGSTPARGSSADASSDGLAPQVREVEAARLRVGDDLGSLNHQVRAQMGLKLEKLAWKLAVVASALVAALGTQKALTAGWKAATKHDPPTNPADPGTGWAPALTWTIATAASAAVAKIVATRIAAAGWEKATGTLPPGLER
jgi:hypothetical protein